MIALYVAIYIICGIITAVIVKFFDDDEDGSFAGFLGALWPLTAGIMITLLIAKYILEVLAYIIGFIFGTIPLFIYNLIKKKEPEVPEIKEEVQETEDSNILQEYEKVMAPRRM